MESRSGNPEAGTPRAVAQTVTAHQQKEGAGFLVRRPVPTTGLEQVDPFLMLDEVGPVEYAPGITAAQGASCSTGVPLTHRGLATSVQYVTGHRQADMVLDLDWKRLADPDSTLVVYMGVANIGQIAMGLMTENLLGSTPVLAVGKATTPDERRLVSRLDRLAADVRDADLKAPTLFIIGKVVSLYAERPVAELLEQVHG